MKIKGIPECAITGHFKVSLLLRYAEVGATHFLRQILHFRQPVLDAQHCLLIIHMNTSMVWKLRNSSRVYIYEPHAGVLGKDMTTASFTPFSIAIGRLVISADIFRAASDLYCLRLP